MTYAHINKTSVGWSVAYKDPQSIGLPSIVLVSSRTARIWKTEKGAMRFCEKRGWTITTDSFTTLREKFKASQ